MRIVDLTALSSDQVLEAIQNAEQAATKMMFFPLCEVLFTHENNPKRASFMLHHSQKTGENSWTVVDDDGCFGALQKENGRFLAEFSNEELCDVIVNDKFQFLEITRENTNLVDEIDK